MRVVKYVKIEDIVPYENNPRINTSAVEKVADSIKKYGFRVPLTLDKNNVIVTGHTRYEASKILGLKELPCIYLDDLSSNKIKAYRLADNKTSEFALWDIDILESELKELDNLAEFGFEYNNDIAELDMSALKDEYFDIAITPKYMCPYCNHKAEKSEFEK